MKQSCHFHPTKPAHWSCPQCSQAFCPHCIIKRDRVGHRIGETLHLCPKCNVEAEWVGAGNLLKPFRNRLPEFFLYPLSLRPLLLIIVLSFISSLFSGPGLLNMLVRVLVWAILIKYSYEVLKTTASGNLTPPKINAETISNDFQVVFKQIGLYVIMGIVYLWLTSKLGIFFGIILLVFMVLSIPAMIILLATTDSILRAINPAVFTRLAFRIGWDYLLMYFFLILLLFAPAALGQYILKYLPSVSHIFLFSFAKSFYTLISYHLMGYVVLQYHAEIGYKVDYEDFKDPNAEQEEEDAVTEIMARVNPLITEGKLDEAINLIQ